VFQSIDFCGNVSHTLHTDLLYPNSPKVLGIQRGWQLASLNKDFICAYAWQTFSSNAQQHIEDIEATGTIVDKSEMIMSKVYLDPSVTWKFIYLL
jgi:hypothetical protein